MALAGLIVPLALGYAQRSHGSTGAGNMAQLTANINRFEVENFQMPDNWDNLLDTDGDVYAAPFTALALDAATADKLNDAGINTVHPITENGAATTDNEYTTFNGTDAGVAVAATLEVAQIPGANVVSALGTANDAADTYVAFGIGDNLSAIGKTMASAPYDFPEGAEKPEDGYRRFIAVFNVTGEAAKFIGVVANDDGNITNIQDHINEYYEATE